MSGIASYGAYIPLWRLNRDLIARAWGRQSLGGERSVANNDEDTVTMALEATIDCLNGLDRKSINGLYFASTSAPFQEKQSAALLATAADLRSEIITIDFGNSLRAGSNAMRAALDAIAGNMERNVVVTASDCRLAYPRSDSEQNFGDAAAAILFSNKLSPIATIESVYSISNDMYDVWRLDKDKYVQTGEERFIIEQGYMHYMYKAITSLLEKANLAPDSIDKAILYAPNARVHQQIIKKIGFNKFQDLMVKDIGVCGCAHSLLMLVSALEESKEGDRLLVASYGDGCDVFLMKVTSEINKIKMGRRGTQGFINSKKYLSSYEKYLSYRGLLEPQPGEPFRLFPSSSASYRGQNSTIRFHGSKCKNCGTVTYPVQRVCYMCYSKDNYEEIQLSHLKGKVFTFTLDNLAGRSDDPVVPQIVMESDFENARIYSLMTDFESSDIKIGMPVELTFRRIYEGAGMYNYFWKCRPVR